MSYYPRHSPPHPRSVETGLPEAVERLRDERIEACEAANRQLSLRLADVERKYEAMLAFAERVRVAEQVAAATVVKVFERADANMASAVAEGLGAMPKAKKARRR